MSGRPRVLYIDDDAALARLVQRTLDRAGYDTVHAPSGVDGLARAAAETFDVIALDHHMPGETGLHVLPRLTALPGAAPIVYVTGSEDSRVAVAALKGGAVDYVWKDVQGHFRDLLVEAIAAAIDREQLRRAKEAADREVREARDRAELMLKEVNHRVSNSLSMIAAFARLQAGVVEDPAARQALGEMQARVHAIAGVHRRLYTSQNVEAVELDAYLQGLLDELAETVRTSGAVTALRLDAQPISVVPDKAVSLGIVVTELVTNAVKYAYSPDAPGEVRVCLSREGERVRLAVEDDGLGWRGEGSPKGTGLGMRVVSAMAASLKTEVRFDHPPRGSRVVLDFDAG